MSIETHLQTVTIKMDGLPGTDSGYAAHAAVAHLLAIWSQSGNGNVDLSKLVKDMSEAVTMLGDIKESLANTLNAVCSDYVSAAARGTPGELDAALTAGADLKVVYESALAAAFARAEPDYTIVRKLLEHQYGDTDLPTFDGMSALGHTVQECAEQVKIMATNKVAVEKGIDLPDMFAF